jgi:HEPN domain-containing protein
MVREEALLWLRQARAELRAAGNSHRAGDWFAAVFWSHQAAEKALKSLLLAYGIARREHNLLSLLDHVRKDIGVAVPQDLEACLRRLNPHYAVARYPDAANGVPFEMYDREDSAYFIDCARRVVEWVEQHLQKLAKG